MACERAQTEDMGHDIITTADVLKKKRDDLKAKRDSLFQKYTKHPNDYHFALEIKTIDDEIAECVQKEQESSGRKVGRPSSQWRTSSKNLSAPAFKRSGQIS